MEATTILEALAASLRQQGGTRVFGSAIVSRAHWNDLHYTSATKQAARVAHEKKGTEA